MDPSPNPEDRERRPARAIIGKLTPGCWVGERPLVGPRRGRRSHARGAGGREVPAAPRGVGAIASRRGRGRHRMAWVLKLVCSEAVERTLQLHGRRGPKHPRPVQRLSRECRVDRVREGTPEIQGLAIAHGLRQRGPGLDRGWPA